MKKLNLLRKRGFTLIEITLVLAVGLGLIVGGLMFFQQAQTSSEVTDKTRALVSISSEVRSQYRTKADFTGLNDAGEGNVPAGATTGAAIAQSPFGVRSGLSESTFNGVTGLEIDATDDNAFAITMSDLDEAVCQRLAISDLGPKSDPTCTITTGVGELVVNYTR